MRTAAERASRTVLCPRHQIPLETVFYGQRHSRGCPMCLEETKADVQKILAPRRKRFKPFTKAAAV